MIYSDIPLTGLYYFCWLIRDLYKFPGDRLVLFSPAHSGSIAISWWQAHTIFAGSFGICSDFLVTCSYYVCRLVKANWLFMLVLSTANCQLIWPLGSLTLLWLSSQCIGSNKLFHATEQRFAHTRVIESGIKYATVSTTCIKPNNVIL